MMIIIGRYVYNDDDDNDDNDNDVDGDDNDNNNNNNNDATSENKLCSFEGRQLSRYVRPVWLSCRVGEYQ